MLPEHGGRLEFVFAENLVQPLHKRKAGVLRPALQCQCGERVRELRRCWGCGLVSCATCSTVEGTFAPGVFNCMDCLAEAHSKGKWDFTVDTLLMTYVAT